MSNYIPDPEKGAVNPYNFVSLGSGVERSKPSSGYISGVIHCSMKNATPLALPDLPNVEKGKLDEHKKAPFFKIDGKPVITGSEIRGVIRSAYETLSNSCLSVNNNNILSARTSDIRNPGVLCFTEGCWLLYKAKVTKHYDETSNAVKRTWKDKTGRNVNFWFTKDEKVDCKNIDLKKAVENYDAAREMYKKTMLKNENTAEKEEKILFPALKMDGTPNPVFFLFENKQLYLSPAQISRSVYSNRVNDLLGSYHSCNDSNHLCEACNLFGMIGESDSEPTASASKLRFTDAKGKNNTVIIKNVTLKELASPKLSAMELYSTVPDMHFRWTYDSLGVKLNGRKFYFHHKGSYSTEEKSQRNITTELVDKGAEFSFDVFFDKLTEDELKRFVWTLAIGENSADGHQMHKLGHGKPLGLGSVKITVDSVVKRSFDPFTMTFTTESMNVDAFFEKTPFDDSAEYFKEYMAVTDFDYLEGKPVAYPYGEDGGNGKTSQGTLVWFKGNRNDGSIVNTKSNCVIRCHLPKITDKKNLVLPALIKRGGSNQKSNNNSRNKSTQSNNVSYEPKPTAPSITEIKCPICKKTMKRQKNKYPMKATTVCDFCGHSFKTTY
ncbi:MAG: RAMP superfamily CRISPR-associated protein [Oscillospiraceae bacterium]